MSAVRTAPEADGRGPNCQDSTLAPMIGSEMFMLQLGENVSWKKGG